MLVRELIEGVQDTLQDNRPAFARWPERALVRWINFGQMALAKYLPLISSRTDIVKMAPGTEQDFSSFAADRIMRGAPADGIALMRIVRNMGMDGATPGRALRGPVDRYSKDALEPDWHAESDVAAREYVFDKNMPTRAWISPGAANWAPVWLEIEWMAYPPKLADGGAPGSEVYTATGTGAAVELAVKDQYTEDLHHYVVAMSLLKGSKDFQNLPKSQHHAGLFMQSLNMQAQAQTGVNPNLSVLPFVNEAV